MFSELLSVLFPLRCIHCGRGGAWLCPQCAALMRPIGPNTCRRCGRPSRSSTADCPECRDRELHFITARAAYYFEGPARSLVHRLKYSGQRRMATYMAEIACNHGGLTRPDKAVTLTYVPLHRAKLLNRGYNQAGLLARALSRQLGLPLQDLLSKQNPTPAQNRLGFEERRQNLAGSIALRRGVSPESGQNSRLVLVDDVYTTGSTASECARVLTGELGVEVEVWTFARTVRR